ncbi:MAG: hypothetical protein H7844_04550 [Nitrospirae bacterium YQR-1]
MKNIVRLMLLLLSVFLILSCSEQDADKKSHADQIQELAKSRKDALDKSKELAQKTEVENLRKALSSFNSTEGRYPKDLAELEQFAGVTIDKGVYLYDPKTGALSLNTK